MCIIDCLSTIVFILPLHLDYTKVIILILWWRNFQLEYWRTFQLVSTNVITMDCESVAVLLQKMRKESKWLSDFLESYRPPLDGERYLTDKEVAELLRVSRRTLQEYRNNRILPFILLAGKVLYPESGLREVLEANYRKPLKG